MRHDNRHAYQFCAVGALHRVCEDNGVGFKVMRTYLPSNTIIKIFICNDRNGRKAVIKYLRHLATSEPCMPAYRYSQGIFG